MARFRKRPVEIDAVRVVDAIRAAAHVWSELPPWLVEAYDNCTVLFLNNAVLIKTLEGEMRADKGDWIIRGVQGELYPCKPDIFEQTYEPAGSEPSEPAEIASLPAEVRQLVHAVDQMRDEWAEADDDRRRDLWQHLHAANDAVWARND